MENVHSSGHSPVSHIATYSVHSVQCCLFCSEQFCWDVIRTCGFASYSITKMVAMTKCLSTCRLPSNTWFLRPIRAITQTASRSVQLFLLSSPQSVPVLYNGTPISPLKIAPSHGGSGPPSNTWFLCPTRVLNPNSISNLDQCSRFCRAH